MIIAFLLSLGVSWGAPHSQSFPSGVTKDHVRQLILATGSEERLKLLGPEAYKRLRDIMFSAEESVDHRWGATLALAKIGGDESLPDLNIAMKNPQWFLRAAALLGKSLIHQDRGIESAKELMRKDPALLVRATALQILAQQEKVDKEFLWTEIYNPINFSNGRGLPIRASILKVLDKNVSAVDTPKLTALMREPNDEIQVLAKASLSKIYEKKNSRVVTQ
jgi:HEAT repeat protein